MKKLDLNAALRWVNAAVSTHAGHALREPEIVILKGTWRGLTYEQMANDSEYSTNYLMRDVAPKLWKQLSGVFDRSVGKTNFRVALEAYAAANAALEPDSLSATEGARPLPNQGLSDQGVGVAAKRQEASHGWISEGALWGAVGASVLSAAAISPSAMYGYEGALTQLNDWLAEAAGVEGQSHLIGVWGLRGVGKTLLVETAVAHSGDLFEGIIWRSLQDQPTLNELSVSILTSLGLVVPPVQATAQLLSIMANRSLLIVLEGVEALLEPDSLVGAYLPEQLSYNDFFQSVVSSRSCVVLTGLEGPSALLRQGGFGSKDGVRSLVLNGLSAEAATELLQSERLLASEQWNELAARYQGHPLALKSAARVIREIFNGRVDTFLSQSSTLFNGIFQLLSPSFSRLSLPETSILYWLSIGEAALSLSELQQTLPLALSSAELISALDSLNQRSLLTVQTAAEPPTFQLPALVKAYTLYQFMRQFSQDKAPWESRWQSTSAGVSVTPAYGTLDKIINLSPVVAKPVQLSHWFQGQFESSWHSLDWLFESVARPAIRLRSVYHLRDMTFVKRCKPVVLSAERAGPVAEAILLVAIQQDAEDAYKVCVQVQPSSGDDALAQALELTLLDVNQQILATVAAGSADSFIQLPYFRGEMSETFAIELALAGVVHRETFVM